MKNRNRNSSQHDWQISYQTGLNSLNQISMVSMSHDWRKLSFSSLHMLWDNVIITKHAKYKHGLPHWGTRYIKVMEVVAIPHRGRRELPNIYFSEKLQSFCFSSTQSQWFKKVGGKTYKSILKKPVNMNKITSNTSLHVFKSKTQWVMKEIQH